MSSIYSIESNKIVKFNQVDIPKEKYLEDFIEKDSQVLGDDLFIIGRQIHTGEGGIVDLIGLDGEGNVVIIEMKKDASSRDVTAQILEYYEWAKNLNFNELNKIAKKRHLKEFPNLYKKFEVDFGKNLEEFNRKQTLYIYQQ